MSVTEAGRSRNNLRISFFSWSQSVALERNQTVCMGLEAKLLVEDYIWRWTTRVLPLEGSNASPLEFEQSTLGGAVLSPQAASQISGRLPPSAIRRRAPAQQNLRVDGWESLARRNCAQAGGRVPKAILELATGLVVRRFDLARIHR